MPLNINPTVLSPFASSKCRESARVSEFLPTRAFMLAINARWDTNDFGSPAKSSRQRMNRQNSPTYNNKQRFSSHKGKRYQEVSRVLEYLEASRRL